MQRITIDRICSSISGGWSPTGTYIKGTVENLKIIKLAYVWILYVATKTFGPSSGLIAWAWARKLKTFATSSYFWIFELSTGFSDPKGVERRPGPSSNWTRTRTLLELNQDPIAHRISSQDFSMKIGFFSLGIFRISKIFSKGWKIRDNLKKFSNFNWRGNKKYFQKLRNLCRKHTLVIPGKSTSVRLTTLGE